MKVFLKEWWKLVLVILLSIISNIVLHGIFSPIENANMSFGEPSVFVKKGILIPALLIWEVITFSLFSLVFIIIQNKLPGKRWKKGLLYGIAIGGLYFIGMFEMTVMFNSLAFTEFLMGLPDFVSFVLSGLLLGVTIGTNGVKQQSRQSILSLFIIAIFYFVGRYFAYTVINIDSSYGTNPTGTFIWTLGLGIWIGIIYFLIQYECKDRSVVSQSLIFGTIILGINWIMNHVFLFAIVEFDIDLLVRVGIDIIFTTTGVWTYLSLKEGVLIK